MSETQWRTVALRFLEDTQKREAEIVVELQKPNLKNDERVGLLRVLMELRSIGSQVMRALYG